MAVAHRVYAEALLQAAKEKKGVDAVRRDFDEFVTAVEESGELAGFLRNPQIDPGTKGEVLDAVLSGADDAFRNFIRLLAAKHRIGELDEIHEEWARLLAAEERVLEVELTTALQLSDDEANDIVAKIEKAAGRKIEATRAVDPDLIGGLVLRAGSLLVDGSVRGRLEQLRQELVAAA
jgi:F-type H+-transporting ATPase subunit delta